MTTPRPVNWRRWLPARASVRVRSAVAAATVVFACLALACGLLLFVLYQSLANTARDAAAARATQIASQLRGEEPANLDGSLLATDAQIGAVQVVDAAGTALATSTTNPSAVSPR